MRRPLPHGALAGPIAPYLPQGIWNGLAIVGQAPGREEIMNGVPMSGPAGEVLDPLLGELGIDRRDTLITNCFAHQPAWSANVEGRRRNNDIMNFFTIDGAEANTRLPPYNGRHLKEALAPDLRATWKVLRENKPKVIVIMGAVALWGIAHRTGMRDLRGQIVETENWDVPVLATYNTAFALYSSVPADRSAIVDTIRDDLKKALPYLA